MGVTARVCESSVPGGGGWPGNAPRGEFQDLRLSVHVNAESERHVGMTEPRCDQGDVAVVQIGRSGLARGSESVN